ncbi:hypothetical protein LZL87_012378 [Fusarium oxysporum]|nr:hypothetical protein LZL87_012378 [Fusarium oxysporum]
MSLKKENQQQLVQPSPQISRVSPFFSAESHFTLHIKDASPEDIPALRVLDKHDFPVHLLDAPKVLPEQFVGPHFPVPGSDISVIGPAVGGAQITFIEGFESLFTHLNLRYHHAVSCQRKENKSKPTDEELKKLSAKFTIMKLRHGPPAPPPADFKMSVVKTRIWHFPKSKLQLPKAQCSGGLEPGTWISTYDAILSIMWRATVRAKSRLLKPDPAAPSKAVHAVNGRGRTGFPISDRYIGISITMTQSKPFTISKVLGDLETMLPILAQAVRESTNSIDPEYISDLIRYAAGSSKLQWSELDMHWALGLDCMAFDWHTMKSYENHDLTLALGRLPH